jgi:hypothetical protein
MIVAVDEGRTYVIAAVEVVRLVAERSCSAIAALSKVKLRPLLGGEDALFPATCPEGLLSVHNLHVDHARVVQLGGAELVLGDLLAQRGGHEAENGCCVFHDVKRASSRIAVSAMDTD